MSSKIDDGGRAFPQSCDHEGFPGRGEEGMSLRDYFAGQALAALLSCGRDEWPWEAEARNAYDAADAMIAARKVKS